MRAPISGIYAIVHIETGRQYIGSAVNIAQRWKIHRHGLSHKKHHSAVMQRAWDKYGAEAFSFVVLEVVDNKADLLKREQHWIDTSACLAPNGFNICPTAGSSFGRVFSQETRKKMSDSRMGKRPSDESRRRMSEARTGVPKSEEHKAKIAAANKARGDTVKKTFATCLCCSKEFLSRPSHIARGSDKFCCRACYNISRSELSAKNRSTEKVTDPETGEIFTVTWQMAKQREEVAA